MSPVPSQDALQYLPSSDGGHEHGGFLQVLSSAINSLLKSNDDLVGTVAELNTSTEPNPNRILVRVQCARDLRRHTRVVFQQSDIRAQGRTPALLGHAREQKRCEIAAGDPLTFGFN